MQRTAQLLLKFRDYSVGLTLQQFLFCFCFIRGSAIWASFIIQSWSANGQLGTNCLEGHKLIGLSYVAPSPGKDYISVPSSPVGVFVLKAEWYPPSPVRKVLQWLLFLFFFFHEMLWSSALHFCSLNTCLILMCFYPIIFKKLRKYVFLLAQIFNVPSFRGGAFSELVLEARQKYTTCAASAGWKMAGHIIES